MAGVERGSAAIGIIGAGPAGSTLAARLAQLGHDVCLIERAAFPRRRLGESLSAGVLPLLEVTGAREAVEGAGFRRVHRVLVRWDQDREERREPGAGGLLVDRGHFDRLLLDRARALGVRVLQPAVIRERHRLEDGWSLRVETSGRTIDLRAAFLADASGRGAALPARRRRTGCRSLALYAYWRGSGLPQQPRIEAGSEAWYWGVPLPDGTYNTLAFVDPEHLRGAGARTLASRFHQMIGRSALMAGAGDACLDGPVRAADATPYLDEESVTPISIKVGDAALAIDPLSSSGVQRAIQTALAGAVVVNTLRRRPQSRDAAMRFYRDSLGHAADRHRGWAASHYGAAARRHRGKFWQDRAAEASWPPPPPPSPGALGEPPLSEALVELSPRLEFVDLPCIEGEFVTVKPALRHPGLDGPLAYLGGWELAPLLWQLRSGMTPLQVALSWSARVPLKSGLAIAGWLLGQGILVPQTAAPPPRRAQVR